MKKIAIAAALSAALSACTSLTYQERNTLRSLQAQGITVDKPLGGWESPASPAGAGLLNILPGFGNFYLASGNGGDSNHYLYGFLNLLTWPISVVWGIPEAAVDANRINERELIYYYTGRKRSGPKVMKLRPRDVWLPFRQQGKTDKYSNRALSRFFSHSFPVKRNKRSGRREAIKYHIK